MAEAAMRMLLRSFLIVSAIALTTPVAQAQVYRGNDTGGIIPWSCETEVVARAVAADFCARYGKFARITSVKRRYGDFIGFNCLWRPNIARYQIPAVGTRSSCRAQARRLRPHLRVRY
jgi:hypothetical protein